MGAAIDTPRGTTHLALHEFGQFYAALTVLIGNELKHNIALSTILVDTLVHLLVVFLHKDDGVLALGHIEVLLDALITSAGPTTQRPGLEATGRVVAFDSVDVERHKQVGLVAVGHLSTVHQLEVHILGTGVDDPHIGALFLDHPAKGQGIAQGERLLIGNGSRRTKIVPPMAGIYHQRKRASPGQHGYHHEYQ